MYTITKSIEFDAGHRVPLHESKCKNPHGHRYKVIAALEGELITEGPEAGMVKDFGNIKTIMMDKIHDVFDHSFIVSDKDDQMVGFQVAAAMYGWKINIVNFYPTAECLAKHFYDVMKEDIPNLISVTVIETPTSTAVYTSN